MITINIFNLIILILGIVIIWLALPEDFKEELGALVGWGITLVWIIIWTIVFPILGHGIHVTFY